MKKSLFFAFAVAGGMLCSCSSEDAIGTDVAAGVGVEDSELVPIQLGVSGAVIQTRGTGTVGGIHEEDNHWNGQEFYLYMFEKGTLTDATFSGSNLPKIIFKNTKLLAPESGVDDKTAHRADKAVRYYPTTGNFDFWAYRIDDAYTKTENSVEDNSLLVPKVSADNDSTYMYVNFKIDGTQDLMTAKAKPETEEEVPSDVPAEKLYSAYSARRNCHPTLKFYHHLTRFTFDVTNNAAEDNGLYLVGIQVESKTTGDLIVAYTDDKNMDNGRIDWADGKQYLALKRLADGETETGTKELVDLTVDMSDITDEIINSENGINSKDSLIAKYTDSENFDETTGSYIALGAQEKIPVGEAMLVCPDESYKVVVWLGQKIKLFEDEESAKAAGKPQYAYEVFKVPGTIEPANSPSFNEGTSYNVSISVYGLEQIVINTSLKSWDDGGETKPIDPDAE